eukprot:10599948-Lingulodinium_polyedra.AAC.1
MQSYRASTSQVTTTAAGSILESHQPLGAGQETSAGARTSSTQSARRAAPQAQKARPAPARRLGTCKTHSPSQQSLKMKDAPH